MDPGSLSQRTTVHPTRSATTSSPPVSRRKYTVNSYFGRPYIECILCNTYYLARPSPRRKLLLSETRFTRSADPAPDESHRVLERAQCGKNLTKGFEEQDAALASGKTTTMIPPLPCIPMDQSGQNSDFDLWRDARLGCFIHWNDPALLAGKLQGKVYVGYAEFIQRMAES